MTTDSTTGRRKVGDVVELTFAFADRSGAGQYVIAAVLPYAVDGERQYRFRGIDNRLRAIGEQQIR